MFNYSLISFPSFNINTKTVDDIFKNISKIVSKTQKGTVNIVFLDDDSIKKLNNKYRSINKTTDVLSFHYFDIFDNLNNSTVSGEIILSEKKIISQGKSFGLGSEGEFYKLLIHSTLHILGYDHELENDYIIMSDLENQIWKKINNK